LHKSKVTLLLVFQNRKVVEVVVLQKHFPFSLTSMWLADKISQVNWHLRLHENNFWTQVFGRIIRFILEKGAVCSSVVCTYFKFEY